MMHRRAFFLAFAFLMFGCASAPPAERGAESPGSIHTVFPGTPPGPALLRAMEEAKTGGPDKVRALLPFFDTEDNERLVRFVVTLKEKAVPPLIASLDDPSPRIVEVAAGLLGELRAKEAVPRLTEFLQSDRPLRYVAAWSLGEIKSPESIPVLVRALSDTNENVAKAATRALINLGRKSTPAIVAALPVSSGRPRKAMLRALEDIEDTRAEGVVLDVLENEKDPVVQAAAARALSKCGTAKAFAPLERWLLSGDVGVRVECAWSLGILIAKPAEGALRKTLEHPDPNVREWSARALENITGERVMYRSAGGKMALPYNLYR
ncbi:MAG: HEAT repeat domain-containing protein [Deltaproteobacteria bacterium]|nr:HEAT repeat domain-containing protein [Deltaproteobacteria bacterium]